VRTKSAPVFGSPQCSINVHAERGAYAGLSPA
jgi:hypothetical protein